jgi:transcriptional regulator with XRE-family HTH domain
MKPEDYVREAVKQTGAESEYALAKRLGIAQRRFSAWKVGREWPDNEACYKLANALKIDPLKMIADIEAQKAKKPEKAEFWRSVLAKAACVIFVTNVTFVMSPSPAKAASLTQVTDFTMYIM